MIRPRHRLPNFCCTTGAAGKDATGRRRDRRGEQHLCPATLSGGGADRVAAAAAALVTTVLLWRVYIYRAGQVLGPAIATAPIRPALPSQRCGYLCLELPQRSGERGI
jgi:hypothetical protein